MHRTSEELDHKELRKEFAKVRKKYFEENPKICGRCGRYQEGIHLHHKIALFDGGTNDLDNLIPLCSLCHQEWHWCAEAIMSFDEFLKLPNLIEVRVIFNDEFNVVLKNLSTGEEVPIKEFLRDAREKIRQFYLLDHEFEKNRKRAQRGE